MHIEKMAQHPQSPSAKWQKFQEGIKAAALRTAAARARTDRVQEESTKYAQNERAQTETG